MRIWPKQWHSETWICSLRGHVAPAASALYLRPEDRNLGIDTEAGRFCRCLRCDSWLSYELPHPPDHVAKYDVLPPIESLEKPRRGIPLNDAIVLRLVAVNRGVHSLLFGLIALALFAIETRLPKLRDMAQQWIERAHQPLDQMGPEASTAFVERQLGRVLNLKSSGVRVLLITATIYAVIEGVEAVGLWRERRWAEYLTVIATAGFLPFEVHELLDKVTIGRVIALVVNLAVLVWLVRSKHLFGFRGGEKTIHEHIDWTTLLSVPSPAANRG